MATLSSRLKPAFNSLASGAWIFVSPSPRDLEQVRRARNELERCGHNPLRFFLKCLEADAARLPALICEEIHAREWFILCALEANYCTGWKAHLRFLPTPCYSSNHEHAGRDRSRR